MADIFISYKREDRAVAERLSVALEQLGFEVWWDFELLSGDRYRQVIRTVIDQCGVAVVLWSQKSVLSDFVMDEANHALRQGKLCPARIDGVDLPFGFGQTHTNDLADWSGQLSHSGFQALVRAIESRVGRSATVGGNSQQTVQAQSAAAELEAFKAAQTANNISALRAFLRRFPRGIFADFVRGQIEQIETDSNSVGARPHQTGNTPTPSASPVNEAQSHPSQKRFPVLFLASLTFLGLVSVGAGTFYFGGGWEQMQIRQRQDWATPFAGSWAPEGLACEFAVELYAEGGQLISAGVPQQIDRLDETGRLLTHDDEGAYAYQISGDRLTIEYVSDEGRQQGLTRC